MVAFRIATVCTWATSLVLLLLSIVVPYGDGGRALWHIAFVLALGGTTLGFGYSIRWGTSLLVHVLALYNDDVPTPDGAAAIAKLLDEPKHIRRVVADDSPND